MNNLLLLTVISLSLLWQIIGKLTFNPIFSVSSFVFRFEKHPSILFSYWSILLIFCNSTGSYSLHLDPMINYIHSCPKLTLQPVLSFSSFVHNSSINEHMNMKLRENICFEIINWILYYWGSGNNLHMNPNDFFLKNYV